MTKGKGRRENAEQAKEAQWITEHIPMLECKRFVPTSVIGYVETTIHLFRHDFLLDYSVDFHELFNVLEFVLAGAAGKDILLRFEKFCIRKDWEEWEDLGIGTLWSIRC